MKLIGVADRCGTDLRSCELVLRPPSHITSTIVGEGKVMGECEEEAEDHAEEHGCTAPTA